MDSREFKMRKTKQEHKPIIETIINTAALAMTAAGTTFVLNRDYYGFVLILFGAGLEFLKYYGRSKKLY